MARRWQRGETLYGSAWVDRPQGLVLVFRSLLHLGLGSPRALRMAAAAAAALLALLMLAVGRRLGGRIVGYAAAGLLAAAGSSPFIESFVLSGELLSALPTALSILAITAYARTGHRRWLFAAGLVAGCALMVRQAAFDATLAGCAYLAVMERRRALRKIALFTGAAAAPVALGAFTADDPGKWWSAVVAYRGARDSILTGSPAYRLSLLAGSLPASAKALALLAFLAAVGWRHSPLLARLWLGAALLGMLSGGNFHYHYYLQLTPPLSLLAGLGVARLIERPSQAKIGITGALVAATFALVAPMWFESPSAQARSIWPGDRHLAGDAAVARYIRSHTRPKDKVFVVWAAASIYYLADREPVLPYMWLRNFRVLPDAREQALRALVERKPRLVVVAQDPRQVDTGGAVARILSTDYERVAEIGEMAIYRPSLPDRLDQATSIGRSRRPRCSSAAKIEGRAATVLCHDPDAL
ncbi:MAG: hypothetical protein C4305_01505 [Thermoleophilia bacterium]